MNVSRPAEWRTLLQAATVKEFNDLDRVVPTLVRQKVLPSLISQSAIIAALKAFEESGRPNPRSRINRFVRCYNAVNEREKFCYPALQEIPGATLSRREEFERLPEPFLTEAKAFVAESKRPIHERAMICRAYSALNSVKRPPLHLRDLCFYRNAKTIMRDKTQFGPIEKVNRTRTSVLATLRGVARHCKDIAALKKLRSLSRKRRTKQQPFPSPSPAIPQATLLRLSPFYDEAYFAEFCGKISKAAALSESAFDAEALYRVQYALYILLGVFFLLTPICLDSLEFDGVDRATTLGQRRVLRATFRNRRTKVETREDVEAGRHEVLRQLIDFYHARVLARFAHLIPASPPTFLSTPFVHLDGTARSTSSLRNGANALLKELKFDLTLLDLRELGVAVMIRAGLSITEMAIRVRSPKTHFSHRYQPLINTIKRLAQIKKDEDEPVECGDYQ